MTEAADQHLTALRVTNIPPEERLESLRKFLLKRHTDGARIANISRGENNVVSIQFQDAAVASDILTRHAQTPITYDGVELEFEREELTLVLLDIPATLRAKDIRMEIEYHSDMTVDLQDVELEEEAGTAKLTLRNATDYHKLLALETLELDEGTIRIETPAVVADDVVVLYGAARLFGRDTLAEQDIEMYMSHKKVQGGDVKNVTFLEDDALITYEDTEDACRVAEQGSVSLRGHEFKVSLLRHRLPNARRKEPAEPADPAVDTSAESVCVDICNWAAASYAEKERIQLAVEARAAGVSYENVRHADFKRVRFQSAEDAQEFLLKKEIQIGEKVFPLQSYDEHLSRAVVASFADDTETVDLDTVSNYFNNRTRSGGGSLESVQRDKESFVVVFKSTEVVNRVTQAMHTLLGKELLVSELKPRPAVHHTGRELLPNTLILTHLPNESDRESLIEALSDVAGVKVKLLYFGNQGTAFVQTAEAIDPAVLRTIRSVPYKCAMIGAELVARSLSVQIHNTGQLTEDSILLYLEAEFQGVEVTKCQINSEKRYAIAGFKTVTGKERVLTAADITIQGSSLLVRDYHERLGILYPDQDLTKPFPTTPNPIHFTFSTAMQRYISQRVDLMDEISQELSEWWCVASWTGNQIVVTYKEFSDAVQGRELCRNNDIIQTNINNTIEKYFTEMRKEVPAYVWTDIITSSICDSENCDFEFDQDNHIVALCGSAKDVAVICDAIDEKIIDKETELGRQKATIEEIVEYNPYEIWLFNAIGILHTIATKYPSFSTEPTEDGFKFQGLTKEVQYAKELLKQTADLFVIESVNIGKNLMQLFAIENFWSKVLQDVSQNGCMAGLKRQYKGITIYASDRKTYDDTKTWLTNYAVEDSVDMESSQEIFTGDNWKHLVAILRKNCADNIVLERTDERLLFACEACNLDTVKEDISNFIKEHATIADTIEMGKPEFRYLRLHGQGSLEKLKVDQPKSNLSLSYNDQQPSLTFTCKRLYHYVIMNGILQLLEDFKTEIYESCISGIEQILGSEDLVFSGIEMNRRVAIVRMSNDMSQVEQHTAQPARSQLPTVQVQLKDTTVLVVKGSLTRYKCDAVANAANDGLSHVGGLAAAIQKEGGEEIRTSSKEYVRTHGTLRASGAVALPAGRLPCKKVIHAVGPHYRDGRSNEENLLYDTITNILRITDENDFKSVAIPAISSGVFSYPIAECTKTIVESVYNYIDNGTGISEIHLVDTSAHAIEHFKRSIDTQFGVVQRNKDRPDVPPRPSLERMGTVPKAVGSAPGDYPKSLGPDVVALHNGVTLRLLNGDVSTQDTDVIVSVTLDPDLNLQSTVISRAILKLGGPQQQQQLHNLNINYGEVVSANSTGRLRCKNVFHGTIQFRKHARSLQIMGDFVQNCFEEAKSQHQSISFPAFGTGNFGFHANEVAAILLNGAMEYSKTRTRQNRLTDVYVVVFETNMVPDFRKVFRDAADKDSQTSKGFFRTLMGKGNSKVYELIVGLGAIRRMGNFQSKPGEDESNGEEAASRDVHTKPGRTTIRLQVGGTSQQSIDDATSDIDAYVSKNAVTIVIGEKAEESERLDELTDTQSESLLAIARQHNVDARFERGARIAMTLVIKGQKDAAYRAANAVQSQMEKMEKAVMQRVASRAKNELLATKVRWAYKNGKVYDEYDIDLSAMIEKAYQDGKPTVQWNETTAEGDTLSRQINFKEKTETDLDFMTTWHIKRKDLTKKLSALPDTWEQMHQEEIYKRVVLQPASAEYQDVLNTVNHIERIQNPSQYRTFMVRKEELEKQKQHLHNQPICRQLFHGTSASAIDNICRDGFNRTYSGKNATAYGQGVYFACDPTYSAQGTYSPPDMRGRRYMFCADTLTADFCQGSPDLKEPPLLPSAGGRYQSVANCHMGQGNPNMFVVFKDCDAYPKYLITFQ